MTTNQIKVFKKHLATGKCGKGTDLALYKLSYPGDVYTNVDTRYVVCRVLKRSKIQPKQVVSIDQAYNLLRAQLGVDIKGYWYCVKNNTAYPFSSYPIVELADWVYTTSSKKLYKIGRALEDKTVIIINDTTKKTQVQSLALKGVRGVRIIDYYPSNGFYKREVINALIAKDIKKLMRTLNSPRSGYVSDVKEAYVAMPKKPSDGPYKVMIQGFESQEYAHIVGLDSDLVVEDAKNSIKEFLDFILDPSSTFDEILPEALDDILAFHAEANGDFTFWIRFDELRKLPRNPWLDWVKDDDAVREFIEFGIEDKQLRLVLV